MRMLDDTGERLLPERQRDQLVYAEHLARYLLATQLAAGRRVLDAASGEGYGSAMLLEAGAGAVTGVDLDPATVEHASANYPAPKFLQADVAKLPFEDDAFELVVSFETIEHVADASVVLAEFRRVLAPGGLLLISTPNRERSLIENAFHVHEFAHSEFVGLLGEAFAHVELRYQDNWLLSTVLDSSEFAHGEAGGPMALDLRKIVARRPGEELYLIALCSDSEPPATTRVAVSTDIYEAHELAQRALSAEQHVRDWVERSYEAERQLAEARAQVQTMTNSRSWRLTRPLRSLVERTQRN